jgi:pyruvate ferredoxin oxidoreductase alpha subunit
MVMLDAFVLSHTLENVNVLSDENVRKFVGTRQIPLVRGQEGELVPFRLDPENPLTMGPLALYDYYFEHKRQQEDAIEKAHEIIKQVHDEYQEASGRSYGNGLIESYCLEDAEIATVCVGSTAGTTKTVVDSLRAKGVKAGLLRLRTFRPFPTQYVIEALENVEALAVMDRSNSFGGKGGPIFHEIRHTLYDSNVHPFTTNYIYGLGGRDMPPILINKIYKDLQNILESKRVENPVQFIGVR